MIRNRLLVCAVFLVVLGAVSVSASAATDGPGLTYRYCLVAADPLPGKDVVTPDPLLQLMKGVPAALPADAVSIVQFFKERWADYNYTVLESGSCPFSPELSCVAGSAASRTNPKTTGRAALQEELKALASAQTSKAAVSDAPTLRSILMRNGRELPITGPDCGAVRSGTELSVEWRGGFAVSDRVALSWDRHSVVKADHTTALTVLRGENDAGEQTRRYIFAYCVLVAREAGGGPQ